MNKPTYNSKKTQCWVAIRLTQIAADTLTLNGMGPALITDNKRIIYASAASIKAGVTIGMPQATAQALTNEFPLERTPNAERQLLNYVMEAAYQFSPYVEYYTLDNVLQAGVLLEVSSSKQLFDGILNIKKKLEKHLKDIHVSHEIGLAHSKIGAWLLSYDEQPFTGKESRHHYISRLNKLPIHLLHEHPEAVDALRKTGFKYLGDLAAQINNESLDSIRKRFGDNFTQHLSDIYDIDTYLHQQPLFKTPKNIYQPYEYFTEDIQFDYPVDNSEQLDRPMEMLLIKLCGFLAKKQHATQEIDWTLYDIYQNNKRIRVRFDKDHNQWKTLLDLSAIQIQVESLPFAVDTLELTCKKTASLDAKTESLLLDHKNKNTGSDFEITLARIKIRLGTGALKKINYHPSHIPELSVKEIPHTEKSIKKFDDDLPEKLKITSRPTWLFSSPYKINNRNGKLYWQGNLHLLQGPERIQGSWWSNNIARDYFIAKREDNLRVWLYKDIANSDWYVQGIFS